MPETPTKPYLLRAIYEWCTDNGYTPYLAALVNAQTRVPHEFVKNGEIVLNISFGATSSLKMDNDFIHFNARFGGVSREISVPVANVVAIYARENGQGMAFEVSKASVTEEGAPPPLAADKSELPFSVPPALTAVPSPVNGESDDEDTSAADSDMTPEPPKKGGRPTLTRIK